MEVAREVEVDLLHGKHLTVTAACRTALHAEAGAKRGFAQGHGSLLADLVKAQRQTDADGGLADTGFRGTDGRDEDEAALSYFLLIDEGDGHLCHITAVGLNLFRGNTHARGNLADVVELTLASDLYVCLHCFMVIMRAKIHKISKTAKRFDFFL